MPLWLRLSIGGAATLLVGMGMGRFSYPPLIPSLIESGQLTSAEAGYVGAFNLLGFLIGAVAALAIRRRLGETRTLQACLILGAAALIASIAPLGFWWLAFWRGLLGLLVAVMMIYTLTVVTRHAPKGRTGAATGIVFTGVGIALLLTGTLVPLLLEHGILIAWTGLAAVGAIGALIGLWGWHPVRAQPGGLDGIAERPAGWTGTVAGLVAVRTLFSIGLVPHTIYWVDYIVRGLNHDVAFGGLQWTLFGVGAISGTFLWGRVGDSIGYRWGLAMAFAVLAVTVSLPAWQPAVWALFASSLIVGAQPGLTAIMAAHVNNLVGRHRMAPVQQRMTLISGVLQAAAAYGYVALFQAAGSHVPLFLLGGAAMGAGALVAVLLRRPDRLAASVQ